MELADGPIYQEVRRRGKKMIRELHKPPEGGDRCEGGVARGTIGSRRDEEGVESIPTWKRNWKNRRVGERERNLYTV
eukprot:6175693-Pleurochrysis_carterae.AAC.1